MTTRPSSSLALCALLAACAPATPRADGAPAAAARRDTVRVDGSPGVAPLVVALARAFEARDPSTAVVVRTGLGSSARARAVAEGGVDVAMASHGIAAEELARRGVTAHEIARVAVVFAVHGGVPVAGLTERQVCDVYAGAATDWRQLGGPPLAVAPRTRPASEVDAEVVHAAMPCVAAGAGSAAVRTVERPEAMAAELAATPGAIGMTSMPFVEQSAGRLRALSLDGVAPTAANVRGGAYRLTRRSVLLTRADPGAAVARFLAYVRGADGARVIAANGAVPVER